MTAYVVFEPTTRIQILNSRFALDNRYETDRSPPSIVEDLTVKNVRWDRPVFKTVTVSRTLVFVASVCLVTT